MISCFGQKHPSSFTGVCVGAACAGGDPIGGLAYALVFNQATVETALSVCNDPTAPDDSIDEATFDGALVYGGL